MKFNRVIKIGNFRIHNNSPVFIIAEAGVNHCGSLKMAKRLIDAAVEVGADAVKFQTFKAEEVVIKNAPMAGYQKKNIGKRESQLEMLKKLELKYEDFVDLKKYCDKKDIIFLSTPHSEGATDILEDLVPAYKIGSGDLNNHPFLDKVAKKGKPIILGTGMATLEEVREAIDIIYRQNNKEIILLHCTTNYPCPLEEVNLRAMVSMKNEFNCLVGYSDHTHGIIVPVVAITLGAVVIEKHFTLNKNLVGPDHKASLEPKEFQEMVEKIREIEIILGSKEKKPTKSERKIMKIARKSIVANKYIFKRSRITKDMLAIKRPGTGIEPKYLNKLIGKFTKDEIKKDEVLTWKKVSL